MKRTLSLLAIVLVMMTTSCNKDKITEQKPEEMSLAQPKDFSVAGLKKKYLFLKFISLYVGSADGSTKKYPFYASEDGQDWLLLTESPDKINKIGEFVLAIENKQGLPAFYIPIIATENINDDRENIMSSRENLFKINKLEGNIVNEDKEYTHLSEWFNANQNVKNQYEELEKIYNSNNDKEYKKIAYKNKITEAGIKNLEKITSQSSLTEADLDNYIEENLFKKEFNETYDDRYKDHRLKMNNLLEKEGILFKVTKIREANNY